MNSLISRFMAVWLHPWQAMDAVKQEGEEASITPYMIFVVVMGLLNGIISAVMNMIPGLAMAPVTKPQALAAIAIMPAVSFIGSFIGAFIIWGLTDGVLMGNANQYKTSYRLLALLTAFSPVTALLTPIPKVGQVLAILLNIYATIVMIQGIIIVRDTAKVKTWVTCGILFVFLFILGIFARIAAQRELANGGAGLGEFGNTDVTGPTDDLGATSDNLEQQLQGMADKAKAGNPDGKTETPPAPAEQPKK